MSDLENLIASNHLIIVFTNYWTFDIQILIAFLQGMIVTCPRRDIKDEIHFLLEIIEIKRNILHYTRHTH